MGIAVKKQHRGDEHDMYARIDAFSFNRSQDPGIVQVLVSYWEAKEKSEPVDPENGATHPKYPPLLQTRHEIPVTRDELFDVLKLIYPRLQELPLMAGASKEQKED